MNAGGWGHLVVTSSPGAHVHHHERFVATTAAALGLLLTGACAATPSTPGQGPATTVGSGTVEPSTTKPPGGRTPAATALPSSHVHGIDRDPGTGDALLATHEGLFVYGDGGPRRVGPVIDLMGFTVAGPDHYYASGHPGDGVDLQSPVGLVETRDGGATWTEVSRGGASDFHALTTLGVGVIGFDGTLRLSSDGKAWTAGRLGSQPRSLAGSPDGSTAVATTQDGLMRSTDGGRSWGNVPGAPLLLLVSRGEGMTLAGITPDGAVFVSPDMGLTWAATRLSTDGVQALDASGAGDALVISVVTRDAALSSRGGSAFTALE